MKITLDLHKYLPLSHDKAMKIAQIAAKYHSTVTLESENMVLNAKSMIGLLSQSFPKDGVVWLIVNGADQQEAYDALLSVFQSL